MGLPIIGDIIGQLFGIGRDYLEGRRKIKQAELDSKLKINEVKTQTQAEVIKDSQKADIAWENTSLKQSGWKAEYWTIVLSIPLIMCFIPGLVPYVVAGFAALSNTPLWYQYTVGIAIGSAFGVRKLVDFMKTRKGD